MILKGSFGLHAKTWLPDLVYVRNLAGWPSTFEFGEVAKQDDGALLSLARLQSKMAGGRENNPRVLEAVCMELGSF